MFRWLNYKGKWKVTLVNGETYQIMPLLSKHKIREVPSDLWGPYILEPRYIEQRSKQITEEDVSDVENAADKETEHKLEGERYLCPDFSVEPKRQNDCGVVTIANILGISYTDAKLKCFHAGWSSSRGISDGICAQILIDEGFHVCFRKDLTLGIVQDFRSEGTFLIHSPKHVMPARNEYVFNQQGQGLQLIQEVWEVRNGP